MDLIENDKYSLQNIIVLKVSITWIVDAPKWIGAQYKTNKQTKKTKKNLA